MRSNIRRHPSATYAPGVPLGYVGGRPVYPIAGGADDGDTDGDGTDAGAGSGSGSGSDTDAGGSGDAGAKPSAKDTDTKATDASAARIAQLEKDLAHARAEAAKDRTNAKAKAAQDAVDDLTQKLGKALGLVKDDTPPDPVKLAEQITAQTTEIGDLKTANRSLTVELAVWAAADKAQAKASALLDSRAFLKAIRELDPADAGFGKALDAAIKTAVDGNPTTFRAAPQAGRSGADLSGGTGESGTKQRPSLSGAIGARYGTS
jgi:hypothetical protein